MRDCSEWEPPGVRSTSPAREVRGAPSVSETALGAGRGCGVNPDPTACLFRTVDELVDLIALQLPQLGGIGVYRQGRG